MYTINYVKIGERISCERKRQKLTQSMLAEQVNLSNEHISHIENGKTKLSLPTLIEICNALGISADFVLMDSLSHSQDAMNHELANVIKGCSRLELLLITESAKSIRKVFLSQNI